MIPVLVVDDDYRVAAAHAASIDRVDGFRCVGQAHSIAEARQVLAAERPGLVLVDVYLPDGHGLDLVAELAAVPTQDRPDVIVVTAARDLATVRHAMQSGALHYLVKPFGFAQLRDRLTAYRRLHEQLHDRTRTDEPDQAAVDELYGLLRAPTSPRVPMPPTMASVLEALRPGDDASATEIAERLGISRATAQRYLSRLVDKGILDLRMRYGNTGRPEHRYRRPTS